MPGNRRRNRRRKKNNRSGVKSEDEKLSETLARVSPRHINSSFRGKFEVTFPTGMVGIPDEVRTCLKYSEIISFTGSATPAAQVFIINSLFDPNFTGVGHQPSFYDFFQSMYSRYCVLGVSAVADVENETAVAISCACVYSDANISGQSVETFTESMRCKAAIVGPTGAVNTKRLTMPAVTMSQIMGQAIINSDANMYASTSSNPNDVAYMLFKCASTDTSTSVTVRVKFTILFDCVFKDVNPSQSSLLVKKAETVKVLKR
jgi:hypothetical protein